MESTFLACRALSGCSAHSLPGSMDKLLIFPSTFLPRQQSKAMWRKGPFVKLAPGTYVARLIGDEVPGLPQRDRPITLNGFYPAMREAFIKPGTVRRIFEIDEGMQINMQS
jgi:hypothetical protein